jgi:hypothetical protein
VRLTFPAVKSRAGFHRHVTHIGHTCKFDAVMGLKSYILIKNRPNTRPGFLSPQFPIYCPIFYRRISGKAASSRSP